MALDIVGTATKVFGALAQRLLRKWLFEVEFISGKYVVSTYERGDSPRVDVWLSIRVHNRNNSPTTVFPDRLVITLADGEEDCFDLPTVAPYGRLVSPFEASRQIQVGGSSTLELTFSSSKYFPRLPDSYLRGIPPRVTLRLAETFGNRREVSGMLEFGQILKQ